MKVSVWIRSSEGGKRAYVKANPKKSYPDGTVFHLRYTEDGQRKWEQLGGLVGCRSAHAQARIVEARLMMGEASTPPAPQERRMGLQDAVERYLLNTAATRSSRTAGAYTYTLGEFTKICKKKYLDQVTKQDLTDFVAAMRREGLSDRTCSNRVTEVSTFLRASGITRIAMRVKFTKKVVSAYTAQELSSLFAACNDDERLLFKFFLYSGCRDREVAHACYGDIDFDGKTLTLRDRPEYGFTLKDREERVVPLPDTLVDALAARKRMRQDDKLIFPNRHGGPNLHFLRRLKDIVKRAGLPGKWELHKFRRSYATFQHEDGVSARTIQRRLGHSSLETTAMYLAAADETGAAAREQVNRSFARFA